MALDRQVLDQDCEQIFATGQRQCFDQSLPERWPTEASIRNCFRLGSIRRGVN